MRLVWIVCWALVGCGGGLVPARPTETVRVVGESSDALGRTIEADARGFVHVELHEGPSVWVERARVAPAAIAIGTAVVVRDATGVLSTARVLESSDRLLAVDVSGARVLVPLDRVLAVLHVAPQDASSEVVSTEVVTPPTPPPPDPRRFATVASGTELFERVHVVGCSGASARVLADDGTIASVPARDLRSARVQVGERVGALWQNGDTAYAGVVIALEGRLANVRYEDESEEWVQPSQIVRRETTSAGTAIACPRDGGFVMVRRGPVRRVVEVRSCSREGVTTHAGDAPDEVHALSELRTLAVPDGARIEVMWHQRSPYAGWAGATRDGRVDVRYDDGSRETTPLTDVRWIASEWESEPFLCP